MTGVSLTTDQVLAWRLAQHSLDRRAPAKALYETVDRIGGLHAQLMSSAELSLWARLDGVEKSTVEQALWKDRTLVKLWALRGTLHLVPSQSYPSWQAALSTYRHFLKPVWLRNFGITEPELLQLIEAVDQTLRDRVLTRDELATEVGRVTGSPELGEKLRGSWGAYLKPASFRGSLIFGPSRGQNVGFTNPATWLQKTEAADPQEALRDLLRRFLSAYGPSTREDFTRWAAHGPGDAGKLLKSLADELTQVEVEGRAAWLLTKDVPDVQAAKLANTVNLIPAFDPWIIGASRDVPALHGGSRKARIYRPQGWISPVLLVNGRMEGIWKHERKGSRLLVTIEPFEKVTPWVRPAAEVEAERLAAFLGGKLEVAWTAP